MRRLLAVVAVASLTVAGCGSSPTAPSGGTVLYNITGNAKHVSITYQNSSGGTSQTGATLPWTFTWTAKPGDFLYVSAQIDTSPDTGAITVSISKNGTIYQSGTANGFPNIATASGSW